MKKYCLDTSGFSNPIQGMPEDIYVSLWTQVCDRVKAGYFAATAEVYEELILLPGDVGQCLKDHEAEVKLEVGIENWDFQSYLAHFDALHPKYEPFINGTGGSKMSLSIPDFSIVMLGKALALPVISMEFPCAQNPNTRSRKIPDVCNAEKVAHMTFNDLLRAEGITI
jgi:Domain of unknown function (DUF4411)